MSLRSTVELIVFAAFLGLVTAAEFREYYWMFAKLPLPKLTKQSFFSIGLLILIISLAISLISGKDLEIPTFLGFSIFVCSLYASANYLKKRLFEKDLKDIVRRRNARKYGKKRSLL